MGASRTILPTVYMPASTRTDLEKRHRSAGTSGDHVEAVHDHNTWGPTRVKRKKTRMDGVLEVAGSTSRARQEPSTRTPSRISNKSEAAGHRAGKLAAMNTQEVYQQFLPGPSVQGG